MTESVIPEIDTSRPHPARIYDYWLGGANHFAADREAGDRVVRIAPNVRTGVRENRAFLGRAVRYLAAEAGIRQFLDIGAGLPAANNVHEVAQEIAPSSRVLYADNDPLVLKHAQALLRGTPQGRTGYIQADLRDPRAILSDPLTSEVLDFGQPIALVLVSVLHFIADDEHPERIIATLLDALPPGSYLVASHGTMEYPAPEAAPAVRAYNDSGIRLVMRDSGEFARLAFGGLELVPPGVVVVSRWRRDDPGPGPEAHAVGMNGGVARKS